MFIGEFTHKIDGKGRVSVPSKFRLNLKLGSVITRGLDKCLFLYPKSEWKKLASKLANLPTHKANSRAFARFMLSGAMEVRIDKLGRILIPEYLRKYAGLKKEVVLVGVYNRIEIWDRFKWVKYRSMTEKQGEKIAEKLSDLSGI